jgi:hypothetical protein
MPVIPALRRLRQWVPKFQAYLSYLVRSCLKTKDVNIEDRGNLAFLCLFFSLCQKRENLVCFVLCFWGLSPEAVQVVQVLLHFSYASSLFILHSFCF